jgi:hypothetical protein
VSGEVLRVIRDILPGVSDSTLKELRSLVAYSLAAPSSSELREQRLGLLVSIVAAAPTRIPLGEEYESERASRTERGEVWPSHPAQPSLRLMAARRECRDGARPSARPYSTSQLPGTASIRPTPYTRGRDPRHCPLPRRDRRLAHPKRLPAMAAHTSPHRTVVRTRRTTATGHEGSAAPIRQLDARPRRSTAMGRPRPPLVLNQLHLLNHISGRSAREEPHGKRPRPDRPRHSYRWAQTSA